MNQEPYSGFKIAEQEFADNPDPRVPCVLLLDTSGSMAGEPIAELNAGLQQYRDELLAHNLAARRVEAAVLRFGGDVCMERDFATARHFDPPVLAASGETPMAEAVMRGIKLLEDRKSKYHINGVPYHRPWIFLITDGEYSDREEAWRMACEAVRLGEAQKKFVFFTVGTGSANFDKLRQLGATLPPLRLKGIAFRELFRWLSTSQASASQAQVGSTLALPPSTGSGGWAEVPT